jgi:hypothetical protein
MEQARRPAGLYLGADMIDGWEDKTWWFMDENSKIIFNVVIEYPKGKTPPAELVELIELYSQGYRKKKD